MGNELLHIENIKAWYVDGVDVIDGATFTIDENEVLALVGSNGSGKTTLIKTLTDIHPKYSLDKFTYREKNINFADPDFKINRIAVFSEDSSFRYWTFGEYNKFLHEVYNVDHDIAYEDYMIEKFNFEKYLSYPVKDLSMGNKKKFFIIAAMGLRLPLLILDEPVDGLDFESTVFLYELIRDYKKYGSIFMSTHILESINEACDSYVLLDKGKISDKKPVTKDLSSKTIMSAFGG